MKKRRIVLVMMFMALSLSACSSGATSDKTSASTAVKKEETNSNTDTTKTEALNEESTEVQKETITFEELTVVDNDECAIKITELDPNNTWGYTLKAVLENKSSDKTYMYSVRGASINGVQCDPFFSSDVAPGKKSNNNISFSDSTMAENGISDITDIEIIFRVYDSNDWLADSVAEETVHIYPYGEDKATIFEREAQDSDNVIIDNDYVTVIVTGYTDDSIWGYTANLFLVNKTETEVMFSLEDASINGYMIDPFFATSVMPGKCAFKSMSWSDSALEENGIDTIEEIEFTFKAYDNNNMVAEPFAKDVITLAP